MAIASKKTGKKVTKVAKRSYVRKEPTVNQKVTSLGMQVASTQSAITGLSMMVSELRSERDAKNDVTENLSEANVKYIHEIDKVTSRHRIIKVGDSVTAAVGSWEAYDRIAQLDELYAATKHFVDVFPEGVFTLTEVSHITL